MHHPQAPSNQKQASPSRMQLLAAAQAQGMGLAAAYASPSLPHIALLASSNTQYAAPPIVSPYLSAYFQRQVGFTPARLPASPTHLHPQTAKGPGKIAARAANGGGKSQQRGAAGGIKGQRKANVVDGPKRLPSYMEPTANRRNNLAPPSALHPPHSQQLPSIHPPHHPLSHHPPTSPATREVNSARSQREKKLTGHLSAPEAAADDDEEEEAQSQEFNRPRSTPRQGAEGGNFSAPIAAKHAFIPAVTIDVDGNNNETTTITTSASSSSSAVVVAETTVHPASPLSRPASNALITTTTTTTTTTTSTPIESIPPVVSNTLPDLLFLLNQNEHAALMQLLKNRIEGKRAEQTIALVVQASASPAAVSASSADSIPTSPLSVSVKDITGSPGSSGSLRKSVLLASPNSHSSNASPQQSPPPNVDLGLSALSLNGNNSNNPPSPQRSIHFAGEESVVAHNGILGAGALLYNTLVQSNGSPESESPKMGSFDRTAKTRSKSFSVVRQSLPRRPSLMSVKEDGGLVPQGGGAPSTNSPTIVNAGLARQQGPSPASLNSQQDFLRSAIAGQASGTLISVMDPRPRASSMIVRPLGGGGLIALPPNWSRQGSGTTVSATSGGSSDAEEEDEESSQQQEGDAEFNNAENETVGEMPEKTTDNNAAGNTFASADDSNAALRRGSHQILNRNRAGSVLPSRVIRSHSLTDAHLLAQFAAHNANAGSAQHYGGGAAGGGSADDAHRPHSAQDDDLAPGAGNNRRHNNARYTMGSNFLPHSGSSGPSVTQPVIASSGKFDAEAEENGGQFFSLSHASLLLERVALEKALPPLLSDYLSQALEYITTAKDILQVRMSRRVVIEEKLKSHPAHVAEWLSEFAGGNEKENNGADSETLAQSLGGLTPASGALNSTSTSSGGNSRRATARMTMSNLNLPLSPKSTRGSFSVASTATRLATPLLTQQHTPKRGGEERKEDSESSRVGNGPGHQQKASFSTPPPPQATTPALPTTAGADGTGTSSLLIPSAANDGYSSLFVLENTILQDPIQTLLFSSDTWEFDLFELERLTGGHSLLVLAIHLVESSGVRVHFPDLDMIKFFNFFRDIENGYHGEIPYHNSAHGADVLQGMYFFLRTQTMLDTLTPLDVLAGLCAAGCHDHDHRGKNNAFLIATGHPLALLYNDASVLESHHASSSWNVLLKPENDFLATFDPLERNEFRSAFISAILHTDMSMHMKSVLEFENNMKTKKSQGAWFSSSSKEDRRALLDMACHVSDLGNPAKPFPLAKEWTRRVVEEFFAQGDAELALGLKVSPMCDRRNAAVDAQQYGFIDFIVGPLLNTWSTALSPESISPCLTNLSSNKAYYKARIAAATPAPATPATPAAAAPPSASASPPPQPLAAPSTPSNAATTLAAASAAPALALPIQHLHASDYKVTLWKNGQGSTKPVLIHPASANFPQDEFMYRLSSATVSQNGPFSKFEGYKRLLVLAKGGGLRLNLTPAASSSSAAAAEQRSIDMCVNDGLIREFDGTDEVTCELIPASANEAVTDVGLIYNSSKGVVVSATYVQLIAAQPSKFTLPKGQAQKHYLLVLLNGSASINIVDQPQSPSFQLSPLDCLAVQQSLNQEIHLAASLSSKEPDAQAALALFQIQMS